MDWPLGWRVPLVVSAALFALVLLLRSRPQLSGRARPSQALREAKEALERAKNDDERAAALAAAGDACAALVGRGGSAVGYYLRAMRLRPASLGLVEQASAALAMKPFALESLLWRRLAAEEWTESMRPVVADIVRRLAELYREGPVKRRLRARAFTNIQHALTAQTGP